MIVYTSLFWQPLELVASTPQSLFDLEAHLFFSCDFSKFEYRHHYSVLDQRLYAQHPPTGFLDVKSFPPVICEKSFTWTP